MRVVLIAAVLGAAAAPSVAGPAPIVGGSTVPAGKWPDAVAVLGNGGSCTGTLIAPDVVLTAGHCADIEPTRVIANTTNYNAPGGSQAMVARAVAYPSWDSTFDLAVIVLAQPLTGVAPRRVGVGCTFDATFGPGARVHLVGFGLTDAAGTGTNTQLHEATTVVTDAECTGGDGCMTAVSPGGEFVAGGNGTDTCFGDSGGPVYFDTPRGAVAIAAVSRGVDDSPTPCGGGGIYVRIDKVVAWIESTVGHGVYHDSCDGTPTPDDPTTDPTDPATTGADEGVSGGCDAGGAGAGFVFVLAALCGMRRRHWLL